MISDDSESCEASRGSVVVATRSTPSCSSIAHWLSRNPSTVPEAWYVVPLGSLMSKVCRSVRVVVCAGQLRSPPPQRIVSHWLRSEEHSSELQSRENLVC